MPRIHRLLLPVLLLLACAPPLSASSSVSGFTSIDASASTSQQGGAPRPPSSPVPGGGSIFKLEIGDSNSKKLTSTVEIVLFMTLLTLAPALVLSLTAFTRIIIVLSFMKRAMSVQEMPPAMIVTGLSLFLTLFVMKPVLTELNDQVLTDYNADKINIIEAGDRAAKIMGVWLLQQTRETDLELMYDIAKKTPPKTKEEIPFHMLVPAFVISEVKTAFQMGFVLFLPFLVIDIVISALLISMGMFTLPPIVISTPFKILLFILVDGWNLVIRSTIESFYV